MKWIFQKDEIVIVCKQADKENIQKKYIIKEIDTWKDGSLYQIKQKNITRNKSGGQIIQLTECKKAILEVKQPKSSATVSKDF